MNEAKEFGNPMNGFLFHKIFDDDELLENFINSILKKEGKIDKEKTKEAERRRNSSDDLEIGNDLYVHCVENNEEFIVEIAIKNEEKDLEKRALLNWSREYMINYQPPNYDTLLPVYIIFLVNETKYENKGYKSHFKLVEESNTSQPIPLIHLIFLEISKFQESKKMNPEEEWMRFFKYYARKPDQIENGSISKAYDIIQFKNFSPKDLEIYNLLEAQNEERKSIEESFQSRGIIGQREEIALEFIKHNHNNQYIQKLTGLSFEKIENLRTKIFNI